MILIHFTFALGAVFIASALSPDYCWDFSNAGSQIPNTCSGTSSSLTKQGTPMCDFSGCSFNSGDLFEGDIPSDIGTVWTYIIWMKPSTFSSYRTVFSLYNHVSSQLVGELRISNVGLRYNFQTQVIYFVIASGWNPQKWLALYVFSDLGASHFGIGTYVPHYQGTSVIKEKLITSAIDFTAPALAPSDYSIYFGGDYTGYLCPYLLSVTYEVCAANSWIHYKLTQDHITGGQTLQDLSGNGYDGSNGNTATIDSFDGTLNQFGIEMTGTQMLHTPGIPTGQSYSSYSVQISTLYSPTLSPSFKLFENANVLITAANLDITVRYFGTDYTQTCLTSSQYQPRLFVLSLLQTGPTSVQLDFYLNTASCMSLALTQSFASLSATNIGEGMTGTVTEFKVTKLVKGKEAYEAFDPNLICGDYAPFDYVARTCNACHIGCSGCTGPTSFDCVSCASPYIFTLEGECVLCGNGVVDTGEQCDDSNQLDGDGCSSLCQYESSQDACLPSTSLCKEITPLLIEETLIQRSNDQLVLKIFLSGEVFVNHLNSNLIAFQFQGVSQRNIGISMDQITNLPVRSLQIKLTPSVSLDGTETTSFNLTCLNNLYALDQYTSTPSHLTEDLILLLPMQYQSDIFSKMIKVAGYTMEGATGLNLAGGIITSITLQIALQPLWGFINSNQLIFFIPLIGAPLPRNILTLFRVLSFVTGDFYILDLAYQNSVGTSLDSEVETPFNSSFQILGFSTSSILQNCGIIFLLLIFKVTLLVMCLFTGKVCCLKWSRKCSNMMKWTPFIRFIFEAFFELMICALVNIANVRANNLKASLRSPLQIAAFVAAVMVLSSLIIFMTKLMFVTAYPPYELSDRQSQVHKKYSEVYSGLELKKGFIAQNYFTWFLFRRLLLSVTLVYFYFLPLFQLALHFCVAIIEIVILLRYYPFEDRKTMILLAVNEFHLLFLYSLVNVIYFTESSHELHKILGWIMVASILSINAFNLIYISILQCINIRSAIKNKRLQKIKLALRQKYIKERKEGDTSSVGQFAYNEAWTKPRPQFIKGSKAEEDYIKQTFFCKSSRVQAEKCKPSFFHPLAN